MNALIQRPFFILYISCLCLFFSQYPLLSWSSFSSDDTHIMQLALSYGWLDPYFKPEVYQQLSIVHYTPVVLNIYRIILELFGLSANAFIGVQLLSIATFSALSGFLCWRETQRLSAAFLAIILIFSSTSLLPMLSRFYTIHYILGGIFSLLALLLIQQNDRFSVLKLAALFSTTLLALLCKEVYLMLIPLLWVLLWRCRSFTAITVVTLSLGCYLGLRIYILGLSSEGRSGQGFLADLLSVDITTWVHFVKWYLSTKWLIVIAAVLAMIVAPRKQSVYLLTVTAFALPALAAPHAFRAPELHGDRLFFIFDCGLVIASVMAFYTKLIPKNLASRIIIVIFIIVIPLQRSAVTTFAEHEVTKPSYLITQTILYDLAKVPTTVLTPLFYEQGELMNIFRLLGKPWLTITQNCYEALTLDTDERVLIIFNDTGKQIANETLIQSCKLNGVPAVVNMSPGFRNGLLQWDINVPIGYNGGILAIDRGLAIPEAKFRQRLARPRLGEHYQLFTNKENQWWFSDIKIIGMY